MRAAMVLFLALSLAPRAGAASGDPAEAWRPMHPYIGTWKGTRAGADGQVKVTRTFASSPANHHLEVTEAGGGTRRGTVRAIVSLDPRRQLLVLRHFAADGSATELEHDPAASAADRLVFASAPTEAARLRITYERAGPRLFVERIERSEGGESFAVVSETRFARTD